MNTISSDSTIHEAWQAYCEMRGESLGNDQNRFTNTNASIGTFLAGKDTDFLPNDRNFDERFLENFLIFVCAQLSCPIPSAWSHYLKEVKQKQRRQTISYDSTLSEIRYIMERVQPYLKHQFTTVDILESLYKNAEGLLNGDPQKIEDFHRSHPRTVNDYLQGKKADVVDKGVLRRLLMFITSELECSLPQQWNFARETKHSFYNNKNTRAAVLELLAEATDETSLKDLAYSFSRKPSRALMALDTLGVKTFGDLVKFRASPDFTNLTRQEKVIAERLINSVGEARNGRTIK